MNTRELQPAKLGGVSFDALISFERTFEADIPDYPVEPGYSVQDTIILKPTTINVTAYLTNTPVTFGQASANRVERVAKTLIALYESRQLTTFTCSKGVFRNMGITNLSLPYSADNRGSMEISFKLKQVRLVSADTVDIPDSYGKGGATGTNAGTASTGGTKTGATSSSSGNKDDASTSSSILYGFFNGGKQ